jgi:hypothetical protein
MQGFLLLNNRNEGSEISVVFDNNLIVSIDLNQKFIRSNGDSRFFKINTTTEYPICSKIEEIYSGDKVVKSILEDNGNLAKGGAFNKGGAGAFDVGLGLITDKNKWNFVQISEEKTSFFKKEICMHTPFNFNIKFYPFDAYFKEYKEFPASMLTANELSLLSDFIGKNYAESLKYIETINLGNGATGQPIYFDKELPDSFIQLVSKMPNLKKIVSSYDVNGNLSQDSKDRLLNTLGEKISTISRQTNSGNSKNNLMHSDEVNVKKNENANLEAQIKAKRIAKTKEQSDLKDKLGKAPKEVGDQAVLLQSDFLIIGFIEEVKDKRCKIRIASIKNNSGTATYKFIDLKKDTIIWDDSTNWAEYETWLKESIAIEKKYEK